MNNYSLCVIQINDVFLIKHLGNCFKKYIIMLTDPGDNLTEIN